MHGCSETRTVSNRLVLNACRYSDAGSRRSSVYMPRTGLYGQIVVDTACTFDFRWRPGDKSSGTAEWDRVRHGIHWSALSRSKSAPSIDRYLISLVRLSFASEHGIDLFCTPPGKEHVCRTVCVSVREHISRTTRLILPIFSMVAVAVSRSSSGGVAVEGIAIRCGVLQRLWTTSHFSTVGFMARRRCRRRSDVAAASSTG